MSRSVCDIVTAVLYCYEHAGGEEGAVNMKVVKKRQQNY